MFSFEFCEIFEKTVFYRTPAVVASDFENFFNVPFLFSVQIANEKACIFLNDQQKIADRH